MGVLDFVSSIFKPAVQLVDELHTSKAEAMELENKKLEIKKQMQEIQAKVTTSMVEYQTKVDQLQSNIITAETKSASWLTRNWRPLTMLTFVALIALRYLGVIDPDPNPALEEKFVSLVEIGLGGYVVGRSGEKMMDSYNKGKKERDTGAVG